MSQDEKTHFTLSEQEKDFVINVWSYIDESRPSIDMQAEYRETLSFWNLATTNDDPGDGIIKMILQVDAFYQKGWVTDFFVDFYLQLLV